MQADIHRKKQLVKMDDNPKYLGDLSPLRTALRLPDDG